MESQTVRRIEVSQQTDSSPEAFTVDFNLGYKVPTFASRE